MKSKAHWQVILLLFVAGNVLHLQAHNSSLPTVNAPGPEGSDIALISAEELKAKLSGKVPVTIIDVRATTTYADSTEKIKGAIHVKLRKLKSRLGLPPLKDIPRDREIITYCACPSEESSISAARILIDSGFKHVRALKGGWQEWLKASGPIESKPKGM